MQCSFLGHLVTPVAWVCRVSLCLLLWKHFSTLEIFILAHQNLAFPARKRVWLIFPFFSYSFFPLLSCFPSRNDCRGRIESDSSTPSTLVWQKGWVSWVEFPGLGELSHVWERERERPMLTLSPCYPDGTLCCILLNKKNKQKKLLSFNSRVITLQLKRIDGNNLGGY